VRIGIFTECYKPIVNGVVNSIDGFRKGLTELGHDVFIFCPTYKNKVNENNVISCKSWPLPGSSGYHYIYPLEKRKIAIARSMDIIHTQHPFIMAERAENVAKNYNIPLLFTNHTQYEEYAHYVPIGKSIVRWYMKNHIKKFANHCNMIVAPAKGIKEKLKEYQISTPIEVVPNGIDLEIFKNIDREYLIKKYNLEKNWLVFVFVGRIAQEKNLEFLINAFKNMLSKNPKCYLVLVGGGPEETHYKNIIKKLEIEKNVIITGFLPYKEVPDCLASSDIFVSASKTEVNPLTVLEAIASGLPSIVFDTNGTGEIIENNIDGIKTKPDNLDEFTSAMEKLMTCVNIRNQLGKTALEKSKKYSYLETSKIMVNVYNKAIKIHQNH